MLRGSSAEVSKLQSEMKIMQDEMSTNVRMMCAAENSKKSMENKCRHHEETIRQLEAGKVNDILWRRDILTISQSLKRPV